MIIAVSDLFNRALAPYRKFPKLMMGFIALLFLPSFFVGITKFSLDLVKLVYGGMGTVIVFWILGSILMSLLSLWFSLAYILAIADIDNNSAPQKISAYLKKSRGFIVPAFGLGLIVGLIVLGGFILLIIPGILFSIWFVFVLQARVLDQKRGMTSLSASKTLVNGNWWGVFWRIALSIFLVSIIIRIFGSILNNIFQINFNNLTFQSLTIFSLIVTILIAFVQAAMTPFATAIPTILYLDLKRRKALPVDPMEPPTV